MQLVPELSTMRRDMARKTLWGTFKAWALGEARHLTLFCRRRGKDVLNARLTRLSERVGDGTPLRARVCAAITRATPEIEVVPLPQPVYRNHIPVTKGQLVGMVMAGYRLDARRVPMNGACYADRMPTLAGSGYRAMVAETAKQFSALVYQRYHIPLMELKEHYNRMDPDFDRWYGLDEVCMSGQGGEHGAAVRHKAGACAGERAQCI